MPLPHKLIAKRTNDDPPSYRIWYDGVEMGSISYQHTQGTTQRFGWIWAVDTMPLMNRGGMVPSGDADSFEQAQEKFRAAFETWMEGLHPGDWQRNRDYMKSVAERVAERKR